MCRMKMGKTIILGIFVVLMISVVAIPVSAEMCEQRSSETYYIAKDTSLSFAPYSDRPQSVVCLKAIYYQPKFGGLTTTFLTPGWERCPDTSSPGFVYTPNAGYTGYDYFGYEVYGDGFLCDYKRVNIYIVNFENTNMQNAFNNKIAAVNKMVDQGQYTGAIEKLQNDILKKTDGCALTGAPDKNDWIKDCTSQQKVYQQILSRIDQLQGLS
jgi:hypothetical protein